MISESLPSLGKMLIVIGLFLVTVGLVLLIGNKIGGLPRLPGDYIFQKKNLFFYLPLGTSLLVSLLLSLVFWFFGRR